MFQFSKTQFEELTLEDFIAMFKIAFEKHVSLNKKYLKATHCKFVNIDISNLTDSNKFWKTVKPIADSKIKSKKSITLVKGKNIIKEEGELAKTFNEIFYLFIFFF